MLKITYDFFKDSLCLTALSVDLCFPGMEDFLSPTIFWWVDLMICAADVIPCEAPKV